MRTGMRRAAAVLGVTAIAVMAAAPAQAGSFSDSATSCENRSLERPFLRWLDPMQYVFAPNGGFESGSSQWKLNGAYVVSGNEAYNVHSASDSRSLYMPNGSSATTRAMCVELTDPTLRFFARNRGGLLSLLRVDAILESPLGGTVSVPVGVVTGGSAWQPTLQMLSLANLTSVLEEGGEGAVAFRFVSTGFNAAWQIDDVYVDPLKNG